MKKIFAIYEDSTKPTSDCFQTIAVEDGVIQICNISGNTLLTSKDRIVSVIPKGQLVTEAKPKDENNVNDPIGEVKGSIDSSLAVLQALEKAKKQEENLKSLEFILSENQKKRFEAWRKAEPNCYHDRTASFAFTFVPTRSGTKLYAKSPSGEEIDLTEYENW